MQITLVRYFSNYWLTFSIPFFLYKTGILNVPIIVGVLYGYQEQILQELYRIFIYYEEISGQNYCPRELL